MKTAGIIAEYNPLHDGHVLHMRETRRALGEDCRIICVMSGHVTQRGEFPILTKYARARMAVRAGADLVFELPASWACAGAERFARGGVLVLAQLGIVTHLSFGSESGDIEILSKLAKLVPEKYPKDMPLSLAYPKIFSVYESLYTPNNILGIEYIRAINSISAQISPLTIPRTGSYHDDDFSSAKAIRKAILSSINAVLPISDILESESLRRRAPINMLKNELGILSYLKRLSVSDWAALPETGGGLEFRLADAAKNAGGLEELFSLAKTKRFTHSRIRRACMCAFLDIRTPLDNPHVRLLAIGRHGEELLGQIKCPIISRPAAHRQALELESAITDQLSLCMPFPEKSGLEWREGVYHLYKQV